MRTWAAERYSSFHVIRSRSQNSILIYIYSKLSVTISCPRKKKAIIRKEGTNLRNAEPGLYFNRPVPVILEEGTLGSPLF